MTNTIDGPTEKITNQAFQHHQLVFVIPHDLQIGSTKIHVKGYKAKVVRDLGTNSRGQHLIEVYATNGSHCVEYQFVTISQPTAKPSSIKQSKKPKFIIIKCIDCGIDRQILACNLHNVKRCKGCQNAKKIQKANRKHQQTANQNQ